MNHEIEGASDVGFQLAAMNDGVPDVAALLGRLYTDIVTVTDPPPFAATAAQLGHGQLLLGTDYPYVPPAMTVDGLAALPLPGEVRAAIGGGTALRLLG